MNDHLPQVCRICRKLKEVHLGRLIKDSRAWNRKYFICSACSDRPQVPRLRAERESPPEREARQVLASTGHRAFAEYKIGPYTFDFAILGLRLLVEVDSWSYHRTDRQQARDRRKTAYAASQHWALVRVKPGPHLQMELLKAVADREAAIVE